MYELINGTPLPVREYHGQRVVTFKDIDNVHQRPEVTARKRFNDNRKHFIEGVDFFKISPSEFRTAFSEEMDSRQQNDITLITLTGYLMISKSLTDDLSWSIQRLLVTYFTAQKQTQTVMTLNTSYLPEDTPFGLPVRECNGQRVLTLKDIADVHQRETEAVRKNFAYNRKYFTEGENFFFIKPEDIQRRKIHTFGITVSASGIILMTKSGYCMLAMSFKDCLSRDVQKQLAKNYFKAPEQVQTAENISLQEDKLLMFNQRLTELEMLVNSLTGRRWVGKDDD